MVRENRIKTYRFPVGSVAANASQIIDIHSDYPLNGLLQGIQVLGNNFGATGSLQLEVSGTGEVMWAMTSGTTPGHVSQSGLHLVMKSTVSNGGVDLSGNSYSQFPIADVVRLIGSGVGASKSGLGFNILYI